MRGIKGQSAIEFVILVGAVFFFFLTFLFAVQLNISDRTNENRNAMTKELALTVQSEISLASESKDGYYREFTIPNNILGLEYEIRLGDGLVFLNTTNGKHALALPVAEVMGDVKIGLNVIKREEGIICLNLEVCEIASSPPLLLLAYYYRGEIEMLNEMEELGADIYCKNCFPEDLDSLLSGLSNYHVVLAEDPNFDKDEGSVLEDWVLDGGILFISEHIDGDFFGIDYNGGNRGNNPTTIINLDEYLGLAVDTEFNLKKRPSVRNEGEEVTNYLEIAEYNGGYEGESAIARWNYGEGLVYFFGDFQVNGGGDDFQAEVKAAIESLAIVS